MPGLFGTLAASANSLRFFDQALAESQNNINNANTPGYAKQRTIPTPAPFVPEYGMLGGIASWELESSRNSYAEQSVRNEESQSGWFEQRANDLARIEPLFDVTGKSSIPGALSQLFQRFSAWSVSANDTVSRQQVIDQAGATASRFGETMYSLNSATADQDGRIRSSVSTINALAGTIRELNVQLSRDFRARTDPNLDAQVYATLANLAQYTEFSALRQSDGSITVLMARMA